MSAQPVVARSTNLRRLVSGGTVGNELLTAATGVVLLVLLAVEGLTIIFLGPLLVVHLLVGMALVPPTMLKLSSTGYRFARYYAGTARYVHRGPPPVVLRLTAPLLVVTTLGVLATGVVLLIAGPSTRDPLVLIHKVTFFAWLAVFGVHLVGHLPRIPRAVRVDYGPGTSHGGARGRRLVVALALVAGVALAAAVAPDVPAWLDYQHLRHHHH